MNQLIVLHAKYSNLRPFKSSISSFVIDKQSSFAIQNSNVNHFALTIDKILDRVFVLVQFSVVLNLDRMMYAMIIFTKIVSKIAKINDNDETLIERIILKSFNYFFKNFKLFIVSKEFEMSEKYDVNKFLHRKNKIAIENEMKNSNDHDDDDIDLKRKQRDQQLKH